MSELNKTTIGGFLSAVGEQIRWKRARTPLLGELEAHILDHRDALIERGIAPDEAEAAAVREMGDPEHIGLSLDRVHRPRPNWLMLSGAAALLITGILLLWQLGGTDEQLSRMLIYSALGIGALALGYFCDYTLLAKYPVVIFAALCGICALLPFIGNRWLSTAEQLSYALPLTFAALVYHLRGRGGYKANVIVAAAALAVLTVGGLMTTSTGMLLYNFIACGVIIIYACRRGWFGTRGIAPFIPVCLPLGFVLGALPLEWGHLMWRIKGALAPHTDPYASGWVALRIRELLANSRFIGEGHTSDSIDIFLNQIVDLDVVEYPLASASHRFGYVVFIAVAALVGIVTAAVVIGARRQSCQLGSLTVLAVGTCFAVRVCFFMLGNLGFPFFTFSGIPLFSYCGKLVIIDMFMLGLMLSVFRMGSIARDSSANAAPLLRA